MIKIVRGHVAEDSVGIITALALLPSLARATVLILAAFAARAALIALIALGFVGAVAIAVLLATARLALTLRPAFGLLAGGVFAPGLLGAISVATFGSFLGIARAAQRTRPANAATRLFLVLRLPGFGTLRVISGIGRCLLRVSGMLTGHLSVLA
jgi:hypothetical protein